MEGLGENACAIRPLAPDDMGAVVAIAASSPEAARWSRSDFEQVWRSGMHGWVAEIAGAFAGFLIARRPVPNPSGAADEVEILNVAVGATFRRRGVASRLLEAALASESKSGAKKAFLEVRPSNAPARAFYERRGFTTFGRRPSYYSDPVEDALLLSRELP